MDPMTILPPVDADGDTADLPNAAKVEIAELVARQRAATGFLMKLIALAGERLESGFLALPDGVRTRVEDAARVALRRSYDMASASRGNAKITRTLAGPSGALPGGTANKVLATISGALGGVGGIGTALAELPLATTIIFRAVQDVAAQHGEDTSRIEIQVECLRIFGSGGPGEDDDGIDTSFIGARLALRGATINRVIAAVAPRFAAILGQKFAAQAVPVLGAVTGAGVNYAFTGYYIEMAQVHFGLRRLSRAHGEAVVLDEFHRVLAATEM